MPWAEVPDGRIYYHVEGSGPPVVLIYGAWACHRWWKEQIPALAGHYTVFAIDVRGHGRSSDLPQTASVPDFSRDLRHVLTGLGIEAAVLVGWSMGAFIALQYCMDYGSRIPGLVLIATRAVKSARMKIRVLYQYLQSLLHMLSVFSAPRSYSRSEDALSPARDLWYRTQARKMLTPGAPEELCRWVADELAGTPRRNYFEVAWSICDWEAGPGLAKITCPTLILVGENDHVTSPSYSRFINDRIPGSNLVVLPGQGHYLALEQPGVVNRHILAFLSQIGYDRQ